MGRYPFKEFLSRYTNADEAKLFNILEELPDLSPDGPWLAGGAIRRTLIGDPLSSDFDFFFRDSDQLDSFRKEIRSKGAQKFVDNDHVETYSLEISGKPQTIQLIKFRFYRCAEDVLDSFDFTITQFAYDGKDLITGEYALWDLARRRLAIHKLTYGVATMRRLLKYTKQGYTACAGTMQSILDAVVNDPSVIRSDVQYVD